MSPEAIAIRLLKLRADSAATLAPRSVDMSTPAVERRLQTLGALHRACTALAEMGRRAGLHPRKAG